MSFKEKIEQLLLANGLFEKDISTVMEMVQTDKSCEAMAGRWNDNIEDYPDVMLNILWLSAKAIAVEWIDANCPLAWFRPMFATE